MNNVVIVGRLTKDPELKYLTSGTPVATFTLAINRDYKNKDGSIPVDFIPVEIMGKPAEFVANYITKGRLVGVQGSIRVDRYETPDGEKKTFTKVSGRSIQALESKSKATKDETPPQSPTEFAAVDDDDVPF
ncbi:single-stranded DNA-binding protein [Peptostreptococcus stomatis]